jgi:hypothetical protein
MKTWKHLTTIDQDQGPDNFRRDILMWDPVLTPQICISRLIMKYINQQLLSGYWIHIQNLAQLNLTVLKNSAHLNGLKAIQFAVVFHDQGAIYLY